MKKIYFIQKPEISLGQDFSSDLGLLFKKYSLKNKEIVLLMGQNSFRKTPYYLTLKNLLIEAGANIIREINVHPNPVLNEIEQVEIQKTNVDIIMAVGGGSVIDFGKTLKMRFYKKTRIFVVYTLPGSASIVTPFAIFDNDEFKIGEYSKEITPDYVYINKNIILDAPADLIIGGAFDILSHITESFLSKAATDESRWYALKGLEFLSDYTASGLTDITSLIKADILAGLSERIGLVLFPHAAGHYLTYKYKIPHSMATMYFLEKFVVRLQLNGLAIPQELLKQVSVLNTLFLGKYKKNLRFTVDDIQKSYSMAEKYMPFVFGNNPVPLTKGDYFVLYN